MQSRPRRSASASRFSGPLFAFTAFAFTATVLVTAGCLAPPARTNAETERNRRTVRELFDAMNHADVARLDALYADDFEIWTAGALPISGTRTRAQALEGMRYIDAMFPDGIHFEITGMTAEGDRVAVEAVSDGIHASGKRYHNQYHFLLIVRDGKIHHFKEYMDTMHAKDVLMAPIPGSPPSTGDGSTP